MSNGAHQTITGDTLVADMVDMVDMVEYDRGTGSMVTAIASAEDSDSRARYVAEWALAGAADNGEETLDQLHNCLDIVVEPFCDDDHVSNLELASAVATELEKMVEEAEKEASEMHKKAREAAKCAIAEAKELAQSAHGDNAHGGSAVELEFDGLMHALVTRELRALAQDGQDDGARFWGDCDDGSVYWIAMEQPWRG